MLDVRLNIIKKLTKEKIIEGNLKEFNKFKKNVLKIAHWRSIDNKNDQYFEKRSQDKHYKQYSPLTASCRVW